MPSDPEVDLAGRHAVVTGGARGIGLAIATALHSAGARVSVLSRSPQAAGERFYLGEIDVTNEAQVVRAFGAARDANGPVEILVNNSGIAESAPLPRTTMALWNAIVATNLTGTFLCTREAIPDMIAANFGRILNVASIAGLFGAPYIAAYCASKHGVVGLTRAVAAEYAGADITANALCPGYTETDMLHQAIAKIVRHTGVTPDAARSQLAAMNPEGRIAAVDEVSDAAMRLICGTNRGVAVTVPGFAEF